ncbi:thioredoxin [bacterium]|nr:thioredoxin [bacterium]
MKRKEKLLTLNDENLHHYVLESKQLVLVMFRANWSGPCHIIMPILEELTVKFSGKVKFCKLNVDQFPESAKKFDVQTIPTLLIFKNGRVRDRAIGVISKNELTDKLNALFSINFNE